MYPLIHVARLQNDYVLLRKKGPHEFVWYRENGDGQEQETPLIATTIEEAIRLANVKWKREHFLPLNCGFRYTLPERDEHGNNALFSQMMASYSSSSGIYFDEELGHNCLVQAASDEARSFWNKLKQEGRV